MAAQKSIDLGKGLHRDLESRIFLRDDGDLAFLDSTFHELLDISCDVYELIELTLELEKRYHSSISPACVEHFFPSWKYIGDRVSAVCHESP